MKTKIQAKNRLRLSALFVLLLAALLLLGGCGQSDVTFRADGSGSAQFTFSKAEMMEAGINDLSMARTWLERRIRGILDASSDDDRIKLKAFEETEDSYLATLSFMRIGKLKGAGEYYFSDSIFFAESQNNVSFLYNMYAGDFKTLVNAGNVKIKPINSEGVTVSAVDVASGEELSADDFLSADYLNHKGYSVFVFEAFDFEFLSEIVINFPGKIKAISSENVEVTGEKQVTIRPFSVTATVTREVVNENGNTEYQAQKEVLDSYIGFVLFDDDPNLLLLGLLSLLGAGLIVVICLGIKYHWVSRIAGSEKFRLFRKEYGLYLMMLPGFVLVLIFSYLPMAGLVVAFKNYDPLEGIFGSEWVFFKNFENIFRPESHIDRVFRNTICLGLLKFVVGYPASLILALLLNQLANGWFKKTVQTVSYLPYFISWVIISGMAYNFLSGNNGILNNIRQAFNLAPISWYSDPGPWWTILTITSVWKGVGWGTIMFLAGLTSINSELYEAASIDGAGKLRQVFAVTLPGLMPIIGITLIQNMGNLIRDDFEQIYALVGSSNYNLTEKTEVFSTLIYSALLGNTSGFSGATAVGLLQSVISLAMVCVANYLVRRTENPGLW